MPVKLDPTILEELRGMDLTLWSATHPKQDFFNEKTSRQSTRENKGWVIVALAGPGITKELYGSGATLRVAIDSAIIHGGLADRVTGLRGALMRLEHSVFALQRRISDDLFDAGGYDDDVPF